LDVPLVLFNEVLDNVLRIDRIFRQPQGHLLLIGVSGSGKTTLSRFVAWMNGLKVFQVKVGFQTNIYVTALASWRCFGFALQIIKKRDVLLWSLVISKALK